MSIVGPRPHPVSHDDYYETVVVRYASRHRVRPGITGWAQVNGYRGETETVDKMAKRIEYDLYYMENWSLTFDLKIIVLTTVQAASGTRTPTDGGCHGDPSRGASVPLTALHRSNRIVAKWLQPCSRFTHAIERKRACRRASTAERVSVASAGAAR